jgi:hypothetical protein
VDEERKWSGIGCLSRGEVGKCCLLCMNMGLSFVKAGVRFHLMVLFLAVTTYDAHE